MAESRARRRIREAVESRGYRLVSLEWEPWSNGGEKSGICGGWYGEMDRSPHPNILRDAIAAALAAVPVDDSPQRLGAAECAEAAALKWFAGWLRSDEVDDIADMAGRVYRSALLAALADVLTKENPEDDHFCVGCPHDKDGRPA